MGCKYRIARSTTEKSFRQFFALHEITESHKLTMALVLHLHENESVEEKTSNLFIFLSEKSETDPAMF